MGVSAAASLLSLVPCFFFFHQGENGAVAAMEEGQDGEAPAADSAVGNEEAGADENGN